jgi:hypothetical protein
MTAIAQLALHARSLMDMPRGNGNYSILNSKPKREGSKLSEKVGTVLHTFAEHQRSLARRKRV